MAFIGTFRLCLSPRPEEIEEILQHIINSKKTNFVKNKNSIHLPNIPKLHKFKENASLLDVK